MAIKMVPLNCSELYYRLTRMLLAHPMVMIPLTYSEVGHTASPPDSGLSVVPWTRPTVISGTQTHPEVVKAVGSSLSLRQSGQS